MAEAKKSTKKIIDVQHPGKSAPSGTSKSVIVTNRPIIKDPMMVDEDAKPEETQTASTYKSGGEAVIKPLDEQVNEPQKDDAKTKEEPKLEEKVSDEKPKKESDDKTKTISQLAEEADSKKTDESKDSPEPESEPKPAEPELKLPIQDDDKPAKEETKEEHKIDNKESEDSKTKDDKPSDDLKDDSETEELDKDGKAKDPGEVVEDKELKKRKAEVAKLVESKKYYLPITTVENKHNRRAVVLGVLVSILLIIAWLNIALDAGLISLGGIKPFTNFF